MHNASAHHTVPVAQSAPEFQNLLLPAGSPSYILSMTSYGIEYPLG